MSWIILGVSLVVLIAGAELLVRGAARLAASLGVPMLVIGLTVVAFGTSAPELAVSVKSAWSGQAELAVANVVGSNIFNILFILGVAAVITPLVVSRQLIRQDVPIMILVSAVAVWMCLDGELAKWEAGLLFVALLCYTVFLFVQGRRKGADTDDGELAALVEGGNTPLWKNLAFIAAGLALLVIGARYLVESAVAIASAFGISEAVVGLTIVAIGTSLPEVMTSIVAVLKGQRDIAIGNVVGSNIFNILCVLGVSGLVSPMPLSAGVQMATVDLPVMLAVAVLCFPLFFAGASLSRFEGVLFLALYIAYVWYMIAHTLSLAYLTVLQAGILFGLVPAVAGFALISLARDLWRSRQAR